MSVDSILQTRPRLRDDIVDTEWRLWEHKTLNIHRGVLHWRTAERLNGLGVAERVREQVESRYRVSWWRGFGFGVLIESATAQEQLAGIGEWVDKRANGKGSWQWAVYGASRLRPRSVSTPGRKGSCPRPIAVCLITTSPLGTRLRALGKRRTRLCDSPRQPRN